MNALAIGGLMFLFVILANSITAFVVDEITPTCGSCTEDGEVSFIAKVVATSVQPVADAPDWFNGLWMIVMLFTISLATMLVIAYFIGLPFGGSG